MSNDRHTRPVMVYVIGDPDDPGALDKAAKDIVWESDFEVVNPHQLPYPDVLLERLYVLDMCDLVFVLPNWCNHGFSRAEIAYADAEGIRVVSHVVDLVPEEMDCE